MNVPNGFPIWLGVVLYRNARTELKRLTRSIALARDSASFLSLRVSYLDNTPDEGVGDALPPLGAPDDYALAGRNLGFGAGHNRLMARAFRDPATHAYVCVNPDAALHPDCIAELAAEANRQTSAGLVEAIQFPDEHPKQYDPGTHATPWCSGCVLLVTRRAYELVGGFDENFFMYCEDVDLSWRARAAGLSVSVAPRALAHHFAPLGSRGEDARRRMLESATYLARKWGNDGFARACGRELRALGGSAREIPTPAARCTAPPDAWDGGLDLRFGASRW